MDSYRSHGSLWGIVAWVSIPTVLGLVGGMELVRNTRVFQTQNLSQQGDVTQLKQVTAEAQMLTDMVMQEIEIIRTDANRLAQLSASQPQMPTLQPSGRILHWAEVDSKQRKVIRSARNTFWNASDSTEESYLRLALETIQPTELQNHEMAIFRMKQDPKSTNEWLALAFSTAREDSTANDTRNVPGSFILALIEPSEAFQAFRKWSVHSTGGKSRCYLIGKDGRVLAHSQKSWVSADFSELSLFKDRVKRVLEGVWQNGSGIDVGVDQMHVGAAYFRLGQLPLAIVVEDIESDPSTRKDWFQFSCLLALLTVFLAVSVASISRILNKYLVKTVVFSKPESESLGEELRFVDEIPAPTATGRFLTGNEYLILNSDPLANGEEVDRGIRRE